VSLPPAVAGCGVTAAEEEPADVEPALVFEPLPLEPLPPAAGAPADGSPPAAIAEPEESVWAGAGATLAGWGVTVALDVLSAVVGVALWICSVVASGALICDELASLGAVVAAESSAGAAVAAELSVGAAGLAALPVGAGTLLEAGALVELLLTGVVAAAPTLSFVGASGDAVEAGAAAARWPRRRWLVELPVLVTVVPVPPVMLTVGTDVVVVAGAALGAGTTTGAGTDGSGGGGWVLTTVGALASAWANPPITPAAGPGPVLAGAGTSE
jgi:hypothetical protein